VFDLLDCHSPETLGIASPKQTVLRLSCNAACLRHQNYQGVAFGPYTNVDRINVRQRRLYSVADELEEPSREPCVRSQIPLQPSLPA
jgi:hypothetical protein